MAIVIKFKFMQNWGYNINKDNQIDFDKNDRSVMNRLSALEPSFNFVFPVALALEHAAAADFTTLSFERSMCWFHGEK